jgi:hypothetical protein
MPEPGREKARKEFLSDIQALSQAIRKLESQ